MRYSLSAVLTLAIVSLARVAEPAAPSLRETRETVLLDGARIGSLHTTVSALGDTGRFRAVSDLELNFRAGDKAFRIRREYGDEETSDGVVSSLFMNQLQGGGREMKLTGTVEGDRLHVVVDAGRHERRLRWSDGVLGLAAQERLLTERFPKVGDRFSFLRYEPTFNTVVQVRVVVKEPEAVGEGGKKLLRVEFQPDRLEAAGTTVQPPGSVVWVDKAFQTVRRQIELDGIGQVLLVRATQKVAAEQPEKSVDLSLRSLIPLDRRIARPHETRSAVYRVTLKGAPPGSFVQDGHQEVRNVRGQTFELVVHPVQPRRGAEAGPAAAEFLTSNYFVDSSNMRIRDLARRAVAGETDPLAKALRIERWVKQAMTPDGSSDLVSASQVARELRGDCKAYALLTAALCRAEGIPSRTAVGLIYVEHPGGGPKLGFHMWTEVCLGGRWVGLDGTLGQGGIGACHLKISDHSWYGTRTATPLLPSSGVFGKLAIEVVSVDGGA
jgi:transglutaminase-like putative cysteine protease